MTTDMVSEWSTRYANEIASPTETVQGAPEMTADLEGRVARSQAVADRLYRHWLDHVIGADAA
jgi:hypothetical protein